WLSFVRTGKARSAIRHHLRTINPNESIELGNRLLEQALIALDLDPLLPPVVEERLLNESSARSLDELYADIGVGKRMAALVARHIYGMVVIDPQKAPAPIDDEGKALPPKLEPVVISGNEGSAVQLAPCCHPIPGDKMIGNLKRDQGLVV